MFSIIIPLYNKAPYIQKALQSVYNQKYKDFEVIVVNDGSKDNSADEVQKFIEENSPQNLQLVNQENQGVSLARNNGVKLAKYPYICFLDADDWWEDTFLLELKKLIEEFPQAGIYGTSYFKVKNGQNISANIGVKDGFEKGIINYYKVYSNTLWMPLTSISVAIPKKVYDEIGGFKPELKLGEDFDLWVRIALKYPVAFLNKPLAYYNQDVAIENRGVVFYKIYPPKTHFIFNLDYLEKQEKEKPDLKHLLDLLRVYTLLRYRMQNVYKDEFNKEIKKVNFNQQTIRVVLQYKLPRVVLNLFYKTKLMIIKMIK